MRRRDHKNKVFNVSKTLLSLVVRFSGKKNWKNNQSNIVTKNGVEKTIEHLCLTNVERTHPSLKRLYHKEDYHLLIFCVFSRGRSSSISQKYKLGRF
jgi:hypothetical protein